MSNKESLIPTSNIDGRRRRLPVKDVYSAFYIAQVQSSDSQLYLFFMSLISLFAQGIAFYAITEIAKQYNISNDQEKLLKTKFHADGITVVAQIVFAILLLAYVTGPTLGAWLAARRAPSRPTLHAASVGAFFVAGGLSNFLTIPHPVWFVIAAMVVLVAAPFVGARLARR